MAQEYWAKEIPLISSLPSWPLPSLTLAGSDPGFTRGSVSKGGANLLFGYFFPKTARNEDNLNERRPRVQNFTL